MKWLNQIHQYAPKDVKIILIGNKTDLRDERAVSTEAGQEFASTNKIHFFETSARTGENVKEAFEKMGELSIADHRESELSSRDLAATAPPKKSYLIRLLFKARMSP